MARTKPIVMPDGSTINPDLPHSQIQEMKMNGTWDTYVGVMTGEAEAKTQQAHDEWLQAVMGGVEQAQAAQEALAREELRRAQTAKVAVAVEFDVAAREERAEFQAAHAAAARQSVALARAVQSTPTREELAREAAREELRRAHAAKDAAAVEYGAKHFGVVGKASKKRNGCRRTFADQLNYTKNKPVEQEDELQEDVGMTKSKRMPVRSSARNRRAESARDIEEDINENVNEDDEMDIGMAKKRKRMCSRTSTRNRCVEPARDIEEDIDENVNEDDGLDMGMAKKRKGMYNGTFTRNGRVEPAGGIEEEDDNEDGSENVNEDVEMDLGMGVFREHTLPRHMNDPRMPNFKAKEGVTYVYTHLQDTTALDLEAERFINASSSRAGRLVERANIRSGGGENINEDVEMDLGMGGSREHTLPRHMNDARMPSSKAEKFVNTSSSRASRIVLRANFGSGGGLSMSPTPAPARTTAPKATTTTTTTAAASSSKSKSKSKKKSTSGHKTRPTACMTCRMRKLKCSSTRPLCELCNKRGTDCVWPEDMAAAAVAKAGGGGGGKLRASTSEQEEE